MSAPIRVLFRTWLPLAASWLLMALELPGVSAVLARLPQADLHLAAFGGVALAICFLIEAPIIMLLSASTTLCRDLESYRKVRSFMMWSCFGLTMLHILLAFTPLFDLVVGRIIDPPPEIEPLVRTALQLMVPWTWAIGYRRFSQGLIIRFGKTKHVSIGTLIRLAGLILVLGAGLCLHNVSGTVIGALAIIAGVVGEACYIGIAARRVIRDSIPESVGDDLTFKAFIHFYTPLAVTVIIYHAMHPISSAAITRMPQSLESLAIWPVLIGFSFMFRSVALALPEVIVPNMENEGTRPCIKRFCFYIGLATTFIFALVVLTPLVDFWLIRVFHLNEELAHLGRISLLMSIPLPALAAAQSWYQGRLLFARRTGGISEAVGIHLAVTLVFFGMGIWFDAFAGIYVVTAAFFAGQVFQAMWLRFRLRAVDL